MDVENGKEIIGNLNRTDQMVTLHKWNDELKWKVGFNEIKSLEQTVIFEKRRNLYEIGG